jgi:hypothetical protein
MSSTDVGDLYPIRVEIRDAPADPDDEGTLTDTGSVMVTVTNLVTGLVVVGPTAMTHTSTGVYDYDFPVTQGGIFEWSATAAGAIVGVSSDVFVVDTEPSSAFISSDDALRNLRATGTITGTVDLEQLRWLVGVACDAIERDLGRLIGRHTVTDTFDGCGYQLRLRKVPLRPADGGAVTVTSVTENGITLASSGAYLVRKNGWTLVRGTSLAPIGWWEGIENVTVTYTTICNPIPKIVRQVALNTLARMWQNTQQTPLPYSDDITSEQALGTVVAGLTAYDLRAYRSLERVPIA